MEKIRIRDPGWKKVGSGIQKPEKHPGSATLERREKEEGKKDRGGERFEEGELRGNREWEVRGGREGEGRGEGEEGGEGRGKGGGREGEGRGK